MLLHCYPFHREAGFLANVFSHVYMDVGAILNHVGARSVTVLAEAMELTPFGKMLYSSDAFGLPELHYLGAIGFRRDFASVTGAFVADGLWSAADADRVAAAGRIRKRGPGLPAGAAVTDLAAPLPRRTWGRRAQIRQAQVRQAQGRRWRRSCAPRWRASSMLPSSCGTNCTPILSCPALSTGPRQRVAAALGESDAPSVAGTGRLVRIGGPTGRAWRCAPNLTRCR